MKERVVVAMSGGVDSSVAAALLKSQGYEVIGITMCFNLVDSITKRPSCCGMKGIDDARRVAHKLGIKHYVLNFSKVLQEKVIKEFCREYVKGRTPNPCVRCNQFLKFDALLKKALSLDAKYLATGHYARVEKFTNKKSGDTSYLLKKAKDNKKDQSYFLYRLNQNQLKAILFPLGDYTKQEVRKLAGNFALSVADKLASQEICFVPDADYRRFLKTHAKADIKPGLVVDKENNILGEHKGIAFYTIGQREGLGIARGYPIYVTRIDAKNNRIVVGAKEDAYTDEFTLRDTHFVDTFSKKKIAPMVKIRYNHAGAPARIILEKNKMKVKFRQPQFAVTPGQSAVFYDKDTVLGGGIIDKVI